jgi:hypothetical protein
MIIPKPFAGQSPVTSTRTVRISSPPYYQK